MLRADTATNAVEASIQDRRREERASVEIPIEVSGFDSTGRFESENTSTRNVSGSSCNFHLRMEVEKGMALAIRVLPCANGIKVDPAPVLFYVTRVDPIPGGYSVGAVKLSPRAPWSAEITEAKPRQKLLF